MINSFLKRKSKKYNIFLSHSWKDKDFARILASDLEICNIKVWLDEAEIKIGDSLLGKVQEAIESVDYLAVILSPNSVNSEWVTKELEMAFYHEVSGKKVKILPLVYRECKIPLFLKTKAYADFSKRESYFYGFKDILDRLDVELDENLLTKLENNNSSLHKPIKTIDETNDLIENLKKNMKASSNYQELKNKSIFEGGEYIFSFVLIVIIFNASYNLIAEKISPSFKIYMGDSEIFGIIATILFSLYLIRIIKNIYSKYKFTRKYNASIKEIRIIKKKIDSINEIM